MDIKDEKTTVDQLDIDIDNLINPGADSIMLPGENAKPNLFSRKPEDLSFLDKPEKTESSEDDNKKDDDKKDKTPLGSAKDLDDLVDDDTKVTGRPKMDKQGLQELTQKLIDKKLLVPFDDEKTLDKYTLQDYEELIEANFSEKERKIREEVPVQFFDSLPEEMQYAAKYIADGGQDMKGLFRMLAAVEEVIQLDPTDENDSEAIVRNYLQATNFGDATDIQEEIDAWKDRNELEGKAKKFKPKLDAMQEEMLAYKLQEQEQLQKSQALQARKYQDNVYNVLAPGELNGIKLDKKIQGLLYQGLTQPQFSSISGKQTNLLGHLLEKYQFVEPNHGLIAEALWLLADPESYRSKVRENGEKKAVEKTVRTLKSEEQRKIAGVSDQMDEEDEKKQARIPRPNTGFFKR